MGFRYIITEVKDGCLIVTMNRPEVLNAMNEEMSSEIVHALEGAESSAIRAVVIRGTGRAFCSGQDLKPFRESYEKGIRVSAGDVVRRTYIPLVRKIRELEKPVIAGINGVTAGAGFSIALACDLRVASTAARFVVAFTRIGLIPDAGMTYMLPRLVGYGRFFELTVSNRELGAEEALRMGIVDYVVPQEKFDEELTGIASEIARGPTRTIGLLKRAINRNVLPELISAMEYEAELQDEAAATEDHREAALAFFEKRKPVFKGS